MGSAAAAMALTGPWFSLDAAMRLALIAVIPAVVALSYVLMQVRRRWVVAIGGIAPLVLLVGTAIPLIVRGGRPIINMGLYEELQVVRDTLRNQPPESERTLVVAMHGLEWWSAWVLHTHIAQAKALRSEDWQRFESVLFLEVKSGLQFSGPPGGTGPQGMPGFPHAPPGGFQRPAPGTAPGDARRTFGPPGGRTRGPMPMMGAPIPSDAEIVHEGKFLRLARVRTPPEFVGESIR